MNERDSKAPNEKLIDIYSSIMSSDDDAVQTVCPAYAELCELDERYGEEELIGKGGLKEVYRAVDRRTRRKVALARLRSDRGLQYYDLFLHEAWLLASLRHPNIIKVHDTGVDTEGHPFFTMDLRGNTTLEELRTTAGLDELLEVFLKILDAVAYAHAQGILHLDLKPENIQCDRFGEVLVCDWGIGRWSGSVPDSEVAELLSLQSVEQMTMLGRIKGSLGYMAPEQVLPDRMVDERTDTYALGCMLHTLLCGEPPFTGTLEEVVEATAKSHVPELHHRYPQKKIPAGLEAVVLKALQREPDNRYQTVEALRQEIQKYLGGYSTRAERSGFFKEARLFIARNRVPFAVAVSGLVILSVASVLFVQQLGRQRLATMEERLRAEQLIDEYGEFSKQTLITKKELAKELALAGRDLQGFGVYLRPIRSLERAHAVVDEALELDPECEEAHWARVTLHFITLNFKAILVEPNLPVGDDYKPYLEAAQAFPDYDFNSEKRPSREQLVNLFSWLTGKQDAFGTYCIQMFAYHSATQDGAVLVPELEALLASYNGGLDHFSLNYDEEEKELVIWSDRKEELRLRRVWTVKDGVSVLSHIPTRKMTIVCPGEVILRHLEHLPVEELDISRAPGFVFSRGRTSLPQLKRLTIRKAALRDSEIRWRIQTLEPFEIIEVE